MTEYKEIPLLTARDVELRVQQIRTESVNLLVYKDARVDMRILDECFGMLNWKRWHEVVDGQNYCTVAVKDQETGEWVSKQDVGTPSKTEAEKGVASDSFKRACFNWGIGRELYDAPTIKIKLANSDWWTPQNGKPILMTKFKVAFMQYNRTLGQFDEFVVVDSKGSIRFKLDNSNNGNANVPNNQNTPPNVPNPAYMASNQVPNTNIAPQPQEQPTAQNNANVPGMRCCNCGADINEKVYKFSMERYQQPLCFKCQKEAAKLNGR